jgi:hypothetical protein
MSLGTECRPDPCRGLDARQLIRALENEQDDRAKVNGLFGSLNDWKG